MFSRISNKIPRFHKSHNSRPKLLNIQEFYYLEKPIRKQYVRGLFHKHQAGARRISQEIHQKQTSEPQSSIYSVEPSTYSEVDPTDSNNHSQHPQTESHSVRNDIIVSEERDYDIISKEMKKKTSQDSSNDLKSPTFFNPYFNTFVTIPTSPLVIDNRKLFYMDTKDKEEDHIKLSTREKISSGEDCLTRTERIWQEIDDILEDEGRCDEIPTDGKCNKYKLDSTISRSRLEPLKINRYNEITTSTRVSSGVDSLDCENFEVDLKSPTAATITAPTPSATTATTPRTATIYTKRVSMQNEDKEEEVIPFPRECYTSYRSNIYNIAKSHIDSLRIKRYKENKSLFGWPASYLSDNRDEIDFQSPSASAVTPEEEERIKLTDREKKSSRYNKYL